MGERLASILGELARARVGIPQRGVQGRQLASGAHSAPLRLGSSLEHTNVNFEPERFFSVSQNSERCFLFMEILIVFCSVLFKTLLFAHFGSFAV